MHYNTRVAIYLKSLSAFCSRKDLSNLVAVPSETAVYTLNAFSYSLSTSGVTASPALIRNPWMSVASIGNEEDCVCEGAWCKGKIRGFRLEKITDLSFESPVKELLNTCFTSEISQSKLELWPLKDISQNRRKTKG